MITIVPRLILIWCTSFLILTNAIGQQVIPELTIDFDGTEAVNILSTNDTDNNPGFFGVRNGSFEINDMEGTPCPNTSTDGFNDNLALVLSDVALSNYCNVSIEVITRISNADFEECLSPGSLNPIGCTDFGVSEPGADGLIISIAGLGGDLLTAGYCGSDRIGNFSVSGLDISIGDLITVSITGGTQAVDEFYYIDQILVRGIPESPIPPQIIGDTEYCASQDAIVLNIIPQGGSNYRWFKDDVTLNNDDNELYVQALPNMSDAGNYRVEFDLPGGCPASASLDIVINDCFIEAPIFNLVQTYCSSEMLSLPPLSDNNITGSWDVPIDMDLSNSVGELTVVFTPDNGGLQYVDTITIYPSYSDVLTIPLCPQNFFEINGNTYTVADVGQPGEELFLSADGCDSVIFVEIVQIPGDYVIIDDNYCIDDTIVINNMAYYLGASSGLDTFINQIGCDSIVEIDLSFRAPQESNVFGVLCPDDLLDISGEIYDINRPRGTVTLITPDGCDSIVNVDLSFIETDSITIELPLCPGDIRTVLGVDIDRDFDPNLYFNFGPNGCDSLVNFVVNPIEPVQTFLMEAICPDEALEINGSRYDANNLIGTELFIGSNGCDSTVNIDLQVRVLDTTEITGFYCESQNFSTMVGGVVYDISNPFGQEVLIDQNGCDSLVSIDLMIQPSSTGEENYTGCQGDGYEITLNGVVYNEQRPQGSELLLTEQGCDSIVTVLLEFLPNTTDSLSYLGCQGDGYSITVNGLIYDELIPRGEQRLTNSSGCDSIITVDLIFAPPVLNEINYVGCLGDNYRVSVGDNIYDELNPSGVVPLVSSSGCDSMVMIELFFNSPDRTDELYRGCQDDGYSITVNGTVYDQSNPSGQESLTNLAGCDSLVEIALEFEMTSTDTFDYLGCTGDGFEVIVGNNTYDEDAPTGSEQLQSSSGCDSMVSVELMFLEPILSDVLYNGCAGDGYFIEVNNQRYDELNPFGVESLLASNGCDSIIMIDLVYTVLDTAYLTDVICARNGTSRFVNGTVYDQSNPSGVEVFTSLAGCDSVVVVDLEFTEVITFDIVDTICFGTSIVVDGNTYDSNNPIGTERILLANGCDSIINVDLSFVSPAEFSFSIDTLVSNQSFQLKIVEVQLIESIEWMSSGLDCSDCVDPILSTSENTQVRARINDVFGCSSLIDLPIIIDQSLPNIYVPNAMSLSSVSGNDRLRPVLPQGLSASYDLMIYDRWGGIIHRESQASTDNVDSGWNGMFNSEDVTKGVYIYSITVYIAGLDPIEMTGSVTVF